MQADEVARPLHREAWVSEEKYDGWRMVAYKDSTAV
jgi:ATP-dependent DNA ligase